MMSADDRLDTVLIDALQDTAGVVSVYLFGSVARNRAHRDSDVDVGVLLDRRIHPRPVDRFEVQLRLTTALQAAAGRPVDLVVLNDAPPHLCRHVMCEGRRLLLVEPEQDHAHRRLALSRSADLEPFLQRTRAVTLAAVAP